MVDVGMVMKMALSAIVYYFFLYKSVRSLLNNHYYLNVCLTYTCSIFYIHCGLLTDTMWIIQRCFEDFLKIHDRFFTDTLRIIHSCIADLYDEEIPGILHFSITVVVNHNLTSKVS